MNYVDEIVNGHRFARQETGLRTGLNDAGRNGRGMHDIFFRLICRVVRSHCISTIAKKNQCSLRRMGLLHCVPTEITSHGLNPHNHVGGTV